MKKQIMALGLALACATTSAYADQIKIRFLNCTGQKITINWTGYKVNVDHEASYDIIQGQIGLPKGVGIFGGDKVNDHTLSIYRSNPNGSTQDEHFFSMDFIQGIYGTVNFTFSQFLGNDRTYGNRILLNSTNGAIYVPNVPIEVTTSTSPVMVADIRIGC